MPERYCIWLVNNALHHTIGVVWSGVAGELQDGIDMWKLLNESGPVNPDHIYTKNW